MALTGRQRVGALPAQVFGDEVVEPLLVLARKELLDQRVAVRVFDVLEDLAPKGAFAEGRETTLELTEVGGVGQARKACAEAREIAEREVIDDAGQAVELEERVLERGRCQEYLREGCDGVLNRQCDSARSLVDVPEAVSLVDDHEVPRCLAEVSLLRSGEVVRAEDDGFLKEGVQIARADGGVEAALLDDQRGQVELLLQLLAPLLA